MRKSLLKFFKWVYETESFRAHCRYAFGRYVGHVLSNVRAPGNGPIWWDELVCPDSCRTQLSECNHHGWGTHDCDHYEDVSIACYDQTANDTEEPTAPSRTPTLSTSSTVLISASTTSTSTSRAKTTPPSTSQHLATATPTNKSQLTVRRTVCSTYTTTTASARTVNITTTIASNSTEIVTPTTTTRTSSIAAFSTVNMTPPTSAFASTPTRMAKPTLAATTIQTTPAATTKVVGSTSQGKTQHVTVIVCNFRYPSLSATYKLTEVGGRSPFFFPFFLFLYAFLSLSFS